MKKNMIVAIFIGLFILLVGAIFGFRVFSKKKIMEIALQNPISEISSEEDWKKQNSAEEENIESEKIQENNALPEEKETKLAADKNLETKNAENENASDSKNTGKIINKLISWGFEKSSGRKTDTIIVHSSYDALGDDPYDVDGLLSEYKQYGVSAHYLISREGKIYRLVEDKNIAYHAGESKMPDGRTGVNAFSIGIEIMNKEEGKFADSQYSALNWLIASLKKQYPIRYILGHDDVAPGRKSDPWGIEWDKINK